MQSSTNTLTVRVCSCDREGNMKLCNAEALTARAGLSTGALVAILLCVIILLSESSFGVARRRPPVVVAAEVAASIRFCRNAAHVAARFRPATAAPTASAGGLKPRLDMFQAC